MSFLIPIAMYGWPLAVVLFFIYLPPRRAVLVSFLGAWMFLPNFTYPIPGLPDYSKTFVTCVVPVIMAFLFDTQTVLKFRPHVQDLPVLVWCVCPLYTSLDNDLGFYDGVAVCLDQTVSWGIPYILGRMYFSSREGFVDLVVGLFISGLVYVPFCLYEVRMSPQLHRMFYGFYQHDFLQTIRLGGYRPMVFMQHGLMVGLWMTFATLFGIWLVQVRLVKPILGIPPAFLPGVLFVTTVLCKSSGALVLLMLAVFLLAASVSIRARWPMGLLLIIPFFYIGGRVTDMWDGTGVVKVIASVNEDRAESLKFRFDNENILVEKALHRPVWGWGGYGRSRVYKKELEYRFEPGGVFIDPGRTDWLSRLIADHTAMQRLVFGVRRRDPATAFADLGPDISVTDGFWIIVMGQFGLVGLCAVMALLLLPVAITLHLSPVEEWTDPRRCGAVLLAALLGVFVVDSLLNAMANPIYVIVAGALAGLPQIVRLESEVEWHGNGSESDRDSFADSGGAAAVRII